MAATGPEPSRLERWRYFFDVRFAVDFFVGDFLEGDFFLEAADFDCVLLDAFFGTFLPFLRASDRPMAIACFRLLTVPPLPPLPLLSVPFFSLRTALSTSFDALGEYLRAMTILYARVIQPDDNADCVNRFTRPRARRLWWRGLAVTWEGEHAPAVEEGRMHDRQHCSNA
jgi:hypothetical protein